MEAMPATRTPVETFNTPLSMTSSHFLEMRSSEGIVWDDIAIEADLYQISYTSIGVWFVSGGENTGDLVAAEVADAAEQTRRAPRLEAALSVIPELSGERRRSGKGGQASTASLASSA